MTTQPEPILCYVSGPWAFFTTQPLDKQWGDDCNDKPYECNAGNPYGPHKDDDPTWEISILAFEGPFDAPHENYLHYRWSVHEINSGAVPWLSNKNYVSSDHIDVEIFAGTPLSEFKRLIRLGGGELFVREEENG